MKIINIIFFTALIPFFYYSNPNQNNSTMKDTSEECSKFYPFKDHFINLETNEAVEIDVLPNTNFKTCSKYAWRFRQPLNDSVYVDGRLFAVEKNRDKAQYLINIFEDGKFIKSIQAPTEKPLPEVHDYNLYLTVYQNDVILVMEGMYTTHYRICKYNSEGEVLMLDSIEHTFITHPEPNTDYHHRYLYFHGITGGEIIFTSHMAFAKKDKTVILNMEDFSTREFEFNASGIIANEDENKVAGFISGEDGQYKIRMLDGQKFSFAIEHGDPACNCILKGDKLYIATYHPIATGSGLQCFNLSTKKMQWTADVKQLNVGHSEYWNTVTLSIYKNKIVMEGNEAYGDYVQIFDAETGKRLAAFGDFIELNGE